MPNAAAKCANGAPLACAFISISAALCAPLCASCAMVCSFHLCHWAARCPARQGEALLGNRLVCYASLPCLREGALPNVPIPKFARGCGAFLRDLRNQKGH